MNTLILPYSKISELFGTNWRVDINNNKAMQLNSLYVRVVDMEIEYVKPDYYNSSLVNNIEIRRLQDPLVSIRFYFD